MNKSHWLLNRRQFVTGLGATSILPCLPGHAGESTANINNLTELTGKEFHLIISECDVNFTGRRRRAVCVNGSIPGPTLRMREGDTVTIHVTNQLREDTSIHWHGIILPSNMDGVPGLSFDGIKPGSTFMYQFTLQQSGTYWYHSHSDYQEPLGLYGALIVEPHHSVASHFDREHTIILSDWSDTQPEKIYANLKKLSHYYNTRKRTLLDLADDLAADGLGQTLADRNMWNQMRMMDTDIADVSGAAYTYLVNGNNPAGNWLADFVPGEKVRLRFINASSMSIFDVRIPGLPLTVVAADGQEVQAVAVDEFRIGTAEIYDVIVQPGAGAYTIFAQSIDRSGYARATLTSNPGVGAVIPAMDARPLLTHADMGMNHDAGMRHPMPMDHSSHNNASASDNEHSMSHGTQHMTDEKQMLAAAGMGSGAAIVHASSEFGPQVDMRAEMPASGLSDPGVGLRDHLQRYGRRVLNYGDLRSLAPTRDKRQPGREIQLHLTGNMNRYMWSMNGIKFADAEPLTLAFNERIRIVLVNDTMMTHPIHLHGLWSELETGDPAYIPRKHTVLVQPGSTISYLLTADAEGRWAHHCHLLYHMAGMFREVRVEKSSMPNHGGQHEHHSW